MCNWQNFLITFFAGWFNYIVLLVAAVQCELSLSRGPSAANLPGKEPWVELKHKELLI